MAFKSVLSLTVVGSISWFAGSYVERQKVLNDINNSCQISKVKKLPALPIFGTVSAASPIPYKQEQSNVSRVGQIMKYGFPGLDNVKSFDDFVLSYDRRNRVAHWVFEHLNKETITFNAEVDRAKCEFTVDESIHPYFRSDNTDYKRSGYDRGHLAAAGNHKANQKHIQQTFFLSNMAPQVGIGFNRHSWNRLEKHVRKMTKMYKDVYCCTGPLYLPRHESDGKKYIKYEVIGANNVAVPTHFFKVLVGETPDGKFEMEAYVMPNQVIEDTTPLHVFQVPPETVERSAGLLFFDTLTKSKLNKINGKKC